jgi:hypothetical protein
MSCRATLRLSGFALVAAVLTQVSFEQYRHCVEQLSPGVPCCGQYECVLQLPIEPPASDGRQAYPAPSSAEASRERQLAQQNLEDEQ